MQLYITYQPTTSESKKIIQFVELPKSMSVAKMSIVVVQWPPCPMIHQWLMQKIQWTESENNRYIITRFYLRQLVDDCERVLVKPEDAYHIFSLKPNEPIPTIDLRKVSTDLKSVLAQLPDQIEFQYTSG
jgi:hypothetical protein